MRGLPLAVLLALIGLVGCSRDQFPREGAAWPETGAKPGPFDPSSSRPPGSTGKFDARVAVDAQVDVGAREMAVPDAFGHLDGRLGCPTGSCPAGQLCFERLSSFNPVCITIPPGCTTCACMNPFPTCQCLPPPGAVIICPF